MWFGHMMKNVMHFIVDPVVGCLSQDGDRYDFHNRGADPEGGQYKSFPEMSKHETLEDQSDGQHEERCHEDYKSKVKSKSRVFRSLHVDGAVKEHGLTV